MKRIISSTLACLAASVLLTATLPSTVHAQTAQKKEGYSESFRGSQRNNESFQKIAPFKVFDNLYYVGPGFVSVWLISTPQGAILVDTAQEPYVDHVIDSIKKVGFDLKDIKYIILTHGHLDHFGGAARIQELSGARVASLDEDWQMIEKAGVTPGQRQHAAAARAQARHGAEGRRYADFGEHDAEILQAPRAIRRARCRPNSPSMTMARRTKPSSSAGPDREMGSAAGSSSWTA